MYCPRCAAQNVDDARYCRACGADISLVPQALAGRVPEVTDDALESRSHRRSRSRRHERDETGEPTFEKGVTNIFAGVAFLIVFLTGLLLFRHAWVIWVWFIIPALSTAGSGVAKILSARREQQRLAPPSQTTATPTAVPLSPRLNELSPHVTSEFASPPTSVTEGTTRHLDATGNKR